MIMAVASILFVASCLILRAAWVSLGSAKEMIDTANKLAVKSGERLKLAQAMIDNAEILGTRSEEYKRNAEEIRKNADSLVANQMALYCRNTETIRAKVVVLQRNIYKQTDTAYLDLIIEDWVREKRAEWVATGSLQPHLPLTSELPEPSKDRKADFDSKWLKNLTSELGINEGTDVWNAFLVLRSVK